MFLFILEGLGTSELLLILVVALVIFGPRKLPQLSRSLGKSLANFKRASEDFKQTWEKEVAREGAIKEALIGEDSLPEDRSMIGETRSRTQAVLEASDAMATATTTPAAPYTDGDSINSPYAPSNESVMDAPAQAKAATDAPEVSRARKRDWL